ncbi:MAG: methylated-DNA--[protein]-cysteine S-methyltransferase [Polyangiaceae bacterium]|nr:methylated-DNA--[protein]-cysteine S-methyltransferase [Polyangiaceae bacterium]
MTAPEHYALFPTPIGVCGISFRSGKITGLQLPEATAEATRQALLVRSPHATEAPPSGPVRRVIAQVGALLEGRAVDLSSAPLELQAPPFHRRVYERLMRVPPGQTITYGELAAELGSPGAARAVGQAMRRNPIPILIPCHRVTGRGGLGGFTAHGGTSTKERLLRLEAGT